MATTQLAGLASNFDWKTFVDQIITYERAPETRMQTEQSNNSLKITALDTISSKLTSLQTAVTDLKSASLFGGRTASLSDASTGWSTSAVTGAATGSYKISVSQIATASRLTGVADRGAGLSATDNVDSLTLATLPTAVAVTAGVFTVNGKQVTTSLTDSLQDVFDKISAATGGTVTASYSSATDRISLSSTNGEIVLGAGNDTSNFLTATRLANNGTAGITSSSALGALSTTAKLVDARLKTAITAVDGSGNGSFLVNGVAIAYNLNTDSLSDVIKRINNSSAGVSAGYDPVGDRLTLFNKNTGDTGVTVAETGAGLLGALGLTSGAALTRGQNALFTVNDGETLMSTSNTLSSASHGIDGLSITATQAGTNTVTIAANTADMRAKINAFVDAYNFAQSSIDDQTKVTSKDGKVTTSVLSDNREVQSYARDLRSQAFNAVSGLTGSISRLDNLGIDFDSDGKLAIRDSAKLDAVLAQNPDDVSSFFTDSTNGFAARIGATLTKIVGNDLTTGYIDKQQDSLTKANTDLDAQIAALERQLDQRRSLLESTFIAMETAQQNIKVMQDQITKSFGSSSSSS